MKKILFGLSILFFVLQPKAQVELDAIGFFGGIGSIQGNSTGVTSFTTSAFMDTKFPFSKNVAFRFGFFYARKFEALIISNTRSKYYPFHKGFSIKGVINQPVSDHIFLEEGVGVLLLNDRTFSDTDEWGIGTVFSFLAGIDFRDNEQTGFKIGIGTEVGITFTATTPQFFSLHFQTAYYF